MIVPEKTRVALEWDSLVDALVSRCETEPGRQWAKVISPLPRERAARRLREISQLKNIRAIEHDSVDVSGVSDVATLAAIAAKGGILSVENLLALRNFLFAQNRIMRFLQKHRKKYPDIGQWHDRIHPLRELESLIGKSITEYGSISRSFYPVLAKIEDEIASLKNEIEKRLTALMVDASVKQLLQEKSFTTRSGRYVLPLKSGAKGRIRGMVHDVSSSEATIYVEPEIISDLNNRMLMKEHELRSEIMKILVLLSKEAAKYASEIEENLAIIAELDCLHAAAKLSESLHANEPELVEDSLIDLIHARHPLLALMNYERTVPNSIKLTGETRCLLVSGANTGGKTVLLKTVGLCVLLAACGLHIPASADSKIGVFENMLVDIGDDQNLTQSLSTFSGQMVLLGEMLKCAGKGSLLLIDEIVVGTDPRQGAALARAILEALAESGAIVIATTHYSELKKLASTNPRFVNASVSFDSETLMPTYRLLVGIPGASHALDIALRYGIPEKITARARMLLDESELSAEALIEKVHMLDEELYREKELFRQLKAELEREKAQLEESKRRVHQMQAEKGAAAGREFLGEINRLREMLIEKEKELQEKESAEGDYDPFQVVQAKRESILRTLRGPN